jgi:hypothetical protein
MLVVALPAMLESLRNDPSNAHSSGNILVHNSQGNLFQLVQRKVLKLAEQYYDDILQGCVNTHITFKIYVIVLQILSLSCSKCRSVPREPKPYAGILSNPEYGGVNPWVGQNYSWFASKIYISLGSLRIHQTRFSYSR